MSTPEWLDAVPAGWAIAPLYARYEVQLGKMLDTARFTGTSPRPYLRNTDVQWDSINVADLPLMDFDIRDRLKFSLRPGDLLVCEGGEIGRTAIWTGQLEECYFQKAIHRLRPRCSTECPRYLYYALRAAAEYGLFAADANPNTIPHLTAEKLRRHRFPFPLAAEQRAIADFLDHETSRVDELIACKVKLKARVTERFDATVDHAVTEGLTGADLIPTGDTRMPRLPIGWTLNKLKHVGRIRYGLGEPPRTEAQGLPLVRATNIKLGAPTSR